MQAAIDGTDQTAAAWRCSSAWQKSADSLRLRPRPWLHLRPRLRRELVLPRWFTPATAAGLGVLMTGADPPNAFPYFIAIERLVTSDVDPGIALALLAAYSVVYCLPCLALLAIGLRGGSLTRHLRRLHDRFGTEAYVPASKPTALALAVLAVGLGVIAVGA